MSAEISFKNDNARKSVKFATTRQKSKDRVETLDSKAKGFQPNVKARRGTSKDSIETFDSETKGFQRNVKTQRGTPKVAGVSFFGDRGENNGKRSRKLKSKDGQMDRGQGGVEAMIQGNDKSKPVNFDRKRKKIYADQNMVEERSFGSKLKTKDRKALYSSGQDKLNVESTEEKGEKKGKTRGFEQFNGSSSLARARKDKINDLVNKKNGKIFRGKVKNEDSEVHSDGNGMLKKRAERKSVFTKQSGQNQFKHVAQSSNKAAEKKIQGKKSMVDNLELTDDRPKKKKRVIRIDPHDISNKRLDDGIIVDENSTRKQEDLEENKTAQLSMNAQFRAIKPSPSILSFVEDNLLGRRRDIELRRAGYSTELSAPLDNIPFSTSAERERIEETLFRNKLTFFAAAKISSSFPLPDLPEIAFAGRSNVGKSSLLNSLTRQWGVVRMSDKPGLTQTINFFKLGTKLSLVDLPGYGFAYAKEEVKEAWEELVKEYVCTRVGLKRVCLLVDTKWGMKPRDHELIDLMERSQTKYQIVLTKTDLVFPIDVARRAMQIEETLKSKKSIVQPAMMVSSKSGAGIRSLRMALAKIARVARV